MSEAEQRWTDRLHLRRLTEQDVDAVAALEVDPALNAEQSTPEQARTSAERYVADWSADGLGYWAVERHGTLIGVAGLRFMTFRLREVWNLYYRFDSEAWGRGYALEAVQEALLVAQEQSQTLPVVARLRPDNAYARRLAERAGLLRRQDLDLDGRQVFVTHW